MHPRIAEARAPHMEWGEGRPPRHVLITGGTGLVGIALAVRLLEAGATASILTRDRSRAC
jgi:nucleoside-diphosphate-sugar epimerase